MRLASTADVHVLAWKVVQKQATHEAKNEFSTPDSDLSRTSATAAELSSRLLRGSSWHANFAIVDAPTALLGFLSGNFETKHILHKLHLRFQLKNAPLPPIKSARRKKRSSNFHQRQVWVVHPLLPTYMYKCHLYLQEMWCCMRLYSKLGERRYASCSSSAIFFFDFLTFFCVSGASFSESAL